MPASSGEERGRREIAFLERVDYGRFGDPRSAEQVTPMYPFVATEHCYTNAVSSAIFRLQATIRRTFAERAIVPGQIGCTAGRNAPVVSQNAPATPGAAGSRKRGEERVHVTSSGGSGNQ